MTNLSAEDTNEINRFKASINEILIEGCKRQILWQTLPLGFAVLALLALYHLESAFWWIMFFPVAFNTVTEEMVSCLSPYLESCNRFGDYRLDMKRKIRELDFNISPL